MSNKKKLFIGIGIVLSEVICTILYLALIIIASDNEANWTYLISGSLILLSISGILLARRLDNKIIIVVMVLLIVLLIWLIIIIFKPKTLLNVMWLTYVLMLLCPIVSIIMCIVLLYRARKDTAKNASKLTHYCYFGSITYLIAILVILSTTGTPYYVKLMLAILGIILSIISLVLVSYDKGSVSRCQGDEVSRG